MNVINDKMLRQLDPAGACLRVSDSETPGLFLEVLPSGLKKWRLRRRIDGLRRQTTLGPFPELNLAEARALASGDPAPLPVPNFRDLAVAWLESLGEIRGRPGPETAARLLHDTILPALGDVPADELAGADIVDRIIRPLLESGDLEAAERARLVCGRIFGFAVAAGLVRAEPVGRLPEFDPGEISGRFAANVVHARLDHAPGDAPGLEPCGRVEPRPGRRAADIEPGLGLVGAAWDPRLPGGPRC